MRSFLCILLFAVTCPVLADIEVVEQDTLAYYQESLRINVDGSLDVTLSFTPLNGMVMELPLSGYDRVEKPELTSSSFEFPVVDGVPRPVIRKRGGTFIRLVPVETTDGGTIDSLVTVTFHVPDYFAWKKAKKAHGIVQFSRLFLNISDYCIRHYQMEYLLPKGYLLHKISKTEPGYNPQKQPVPPYRVEKLNGHYRAVLTVADMGTASRALLGIEMLKAKRSLLPLLIGIGLSLLYLVFFRDVLRKEKE